MYIQSDHNHEQTRVMRSFVFSSINLLKVVSVSALAIFWASRTWDRRSDSDVSSVICCSRGAILVEVTKLLCVYEGNGTNLFCVSALFLTDSISARRSSWHIHQHPGPLQIFKSYISSFSCSNSIICTFKLRKDHVKLSKFSKSLLVYFCNPLEQRQRK